jgi:hypothetical protein
MALLLGAAVSYADPYSLSQTNTQAAGLTAWEEKTVSGEFRSKGKTAAANDLREWQFRYLFNNDPDKLWKPWKKRPFGVDSDSDFALDSVFHNFSVPDTIADTAEELQSMPSDDDIPVRSLPWARPQADDGNESLVQYSESPTGAAVGQPARAQQTGDSVDFSGETAKGSSKVDYSPAETEGLRSGSPHDPGDLSQAPDGWPISSSEPIPQILQPEPTVTALWGLSALAFAYGRKAVKLLSGQTLACHSFPAR